MSTNHTDLIKQNPVYIYNSLPRKKESFQPIHEGRLGMYVCGPTVYGDPHLGHARSALTFDTVFRYMLFLGYKVRYVRNITDVGHLENEVEEAGEDKIAKKARLNQIEPMEVAQFYTNSYHHSLDKLNLRPPSIEPTASGHILDQIDIIKKVIENGFAYEVNGSVYFDVQKFAESYPYGELSGKVLEELQSNSRQLEGQSEKKAPFDFALWKKATPSHIMKWESPWSIGFPGWHLECSAMSAKYLGVPFDIHGGGMDLKFPHHEGEIAQSMAAFGQKPVNYWMHNNLITIDGQKMSKSLGNFITLEEMFSGEHEKLEQPYSPMIVRFFMLQAHYRSEIDFSNEALQAAEKGYNRLMNAFALLDELPSVEKDGTLDENLNQEISQLCSSCYEHMSDDFNTAKTIAILFEMAAKINAFKNGQLSLQSLSGLTFDLFKETFSQFITEVLGLLPEQSISSDEGKTDALIKMLIDIRADARKDKNFAISDKIRDELSAIGVLLKDEKTGTTSYTIES